MTTTEQRPKAKAQKKIKTLLDKTLDMHKVCDPKSRKSSHKKLLRLSKWLTTKERLTNLKSEHEWVQENKTLRDFFDNIAKIGDERQDQTKISDYKALEEHFKKNYNEDEKDEYVREVKAIVLEPLLEKSIL